MFVKPVKGRSVPDPARGDLLPAEGRNVDENNYWLRREAAGDTRTATNPIPKTWGKSLSARPSQLMWWEMTALTSAIA